MSQRKIAVVTGASVGVTVTAGLFAAAFERTVGEKVRTNRAVRFERTARG